MKAASTPLIRFREYVFFQSTFIEAVCNLRPPGVTPEGELVLAEVAGGALEKVRLEFAGQAVLIRSSDGGPVLPTTQGDNLVELLRRTVADDIRMAGFPESIRRRLPYEVAKVFRWIAGGERVYFPCSLGRRAKLQSEVYAQWKKGKTWHQISRAHGISLRYARLCVSLERKRLAHADANNSTEKENEHGD